MRSGFESRQAIEQRNLREISRLVWGIDWLLLGLGLLSLGFEGMSAVDRTAISAGLCFYAAFVIGIRFPGWRKVESRRVIGLEVWMMIPFVTWSIWFTDRLASPLVNAYLLVVVSSALALGMRNALWQVAVIGGCYMALGEHASARDLLSFAYLGGLVSQLAPLIVAGYITALFSADIRFGMSRARLRSEIDELTGVFSMQGFAIAVDRLFANAERHGDSMSLLVLDIDNLKAVSDAHGRDAGDRVVRHVARCIENELRHSDRLARLGDDEFVALLPDTPPGGALEVGERIRAAAAEPIDIDGRRVASSVSVGVGSFPEDGRTVDAILARADSAMREAKTLGRNRVVRLAL
ncbi:MAG: hypothetical protein A2W21_05720 [Betaproteobacteria bacterium RBG_16_66_20]|nr:MAG: hypothetical protein A2W21_05720 [Betaproteobacteria bacterium RBG_16_66_20]